MKLLILNDEEIDKIAEQVHESWMKAKRSQGIFSWQPAGEELMVPYCELSESAKEVDRVTVFAVLSTLKNMGVFK